MSPLEYLALSILYQASCGHTDLGERKDEILRALPIDAPEGWIWGCGRSNRLGCGCETCERPGASAWPWSGA